MLTEVTSKAVAICCIESVSFSTPQEWIEEEEREEESAMTVHTRLTIERAGLGTVRQPWAR